MSDEEVKVDGAPTKEERLELAKESALIVVHWIGQVYASCFFPQMRIVALEMLEKISSYLSFETRLG